MISPITVFDTSLSLSLSLSLIHRLGYIDCDDDESNSSSSSSSDYNSRDHGYYYTRLPIPHNNFVFTRLNHPLNYTYLGVMNTSRTPDNTFKNCVTSGTNVLFTDHHTIKITHKNVAWRFSFISVMMTSVFQDNLHVFIGRSSDTDGRSVELRRQIPKRIVLDWHNLDNITIGCVDSSITESNIIAFDDFILD